uniref:Uncharacterized protein n=1 Tax=Romanomermis culicivorax TaxID=13658 RepID=A0A915IJH3_ROMCU
MNRTTGAAQYEQDNRRRAVPRGTSRPKTFLEDGEILQSGTHTPKTRNRYDNNLKWILQAVTTARQRAIQTQETSRQIISAATGPLTNKAKARFPRYGTIQQQLALLNNK